MAGGGGGAGALDFIFQSPESDGGDGGGIILFLSESCLSSGMSRISISANGLPGTSNPNSIMGGGGGMFTI